MIDGLRPYPEMKPSGLPWLGDVPAHWDVRKLRHCGSISGGMTPSMADRSLWDGEVPWVTPKDMKRFTISEASMNVSAKALEATSLRLIPAGAVLLVVRGMILARRVPIARTDQPVTINQDMKAIAPSAGVEAGYLAYRMDAAQEAFVPMIDEAGHGTKRFPTERWKELQLALPPLDEQRLIVRFLDWHGAQTAKLVSAKKKIIALLNEQKQAIIHRAVTRGLDPNAKLKPSGIPWLGDVPEHWELKRLKTEMLFLGGGTPSKAEAAYWNGDIPWVSPKDMKSDVIDDASDKITIEAVEQSSTKIVPAGSILIVVRSGILQRTIPIALCSRDVAINQDMKALTTKGRIVPEYLVQFVRGCEQFLLAEWTKQGATVESIEHQFLADSVIPIPPHPEQIAILKAIQEGSGGVDIAGNRIKSEIALIQEFRTRLIADVVTGKLDVRAAAASLPEVTEPEPIEDLGEVDDLDEAIDAPENEEVAA